MPDKLTKLAKHIIIDADKQEIREVTCELTLEYMQSVVHGYIERVPYPAYPVNEMDDLFVNEEGLLINLPYGFKLGGQMLLGNGLLIGQIQEAKTGTAYGYLDTVTDIEELREQIQWAETKNHREERENAIR